MDQQVMYTKAKISELQGKTNQLQNNNSILGALVSEEELKIRFELGMKIERDLEEEIKEGIYHLALRLHRIFQQRKERDAKEVSELGNKLSEMKINIRMEGETKVEIKEVNKELSSQGCRAKNNNVKAEKKFDWEKTLRAGSSPVSVNRSCANSKHKDRVLRGRKNARVESKLLQLGWKV